MIWLIAYVFKFPPSEIDEMDMDDLDFWNQGAGQMIKWMETE